MNVRAIAPSAGAISSNTTTMNTSIDGTSTSWSHLAKHSREQQTLKENIAIRKEKRSQNRNKRNYSS